MPTYQAPTIISAPHSPTRVIRASRQILMHSTSASLPLYLSPLSHRPKRPLWYSAPTFQRYSSLSPFLLPIPLRSSLLPSLPPHVNTTQKNHSVRVPLHLPLKLHRSGRVSHGEHLVLSNFTGVVGAYRCYVSVCNCLVWHLRFYSAWIKNYCVFWVFSALFLCVWLHLHWKRNVTVFRCNLQYGMRNMSPFYQILPFGVTVTSRRSEWETRRWEAHLFASLFCLNPDISFPVPLPCLSSFNVFLLCVSREQREQSGLQITPCQTPGDNCCSRFDLDQSINI